MTYAVIARCPRSGQFGIGIASYSIAVGRYCDGALRANTGATLTQGVPNSRNNPDFDYRQFGIIDRENDVVAHTGAGVGKWAGHTIGPYYAAYGNGLAGPQTVEGIVRGFLSQPDAPLEDRLMLALEGGRDAGGQMSNGRHRPERSAWIRVVDGGDAPEIDLRVDLHDKTVSELRRILEECKRYRKYYDERRANPSAAVPEEDFVAQS